MVGSGLSTLTVSAAEETGWDRVAAPIVTECPAKMIVPGEYIPEAEIVPLPLVPPATPLTDHTTAELTTPLISALYCALPPSLTCVGPVTEIGAGVCAFKPPGEATNKQTSKVTARRLRRRQAGTPDSAILAGDVTIGRTYGSANGGAIQPWANAS
jgi:hypothetical protein